MKWDISHNVAILRDFNTLLSVMGKPPRVTSREKLYFRLLGPNRHDRTLP